MPYSQSTDLCLDTAAGTGGLARHALDEAVERTRPAFDWLRAAQRDGALPLLGLADRSDDLDAGRGAVERLGRGATDIVILGTGGSSLGARALDCFARWRFRCGTSPEDTLPALHFTDNLDPHGMAHLLRTLDLKTAGFLVISKSGGTPETMMQMLAVLDALKGSGLDWNAEHHFLAITDPGGDGSSALRHLCAQHHIPVLEHEPGIGGRYAVLSNVGMVPAVLMGLDTAAIRAGAGDVTGALAAAGGPSGFAPAVGAALHYALAENRGITTTVLMPYADRLRLFSNWFAQLWAESLGKDGRGTTPVAAAGPVDQHSQLQLYLDGPADKYVTILMLDAAGAGPRIGEAYRNDPHVGYLAGHTIGDLVDCEQRATAETLAANGRPVRILRLPELTERTMGALFMHFMLETIIAGKLMGVDPFDQPAVEQGKVLAREYLAQL